MKLIIFGATGLVGGSVLHEALATSHVEKVLVIGRRSCGVSHPKLEEAIRPDLFQLDGMEDRLREFDACIWAIGIPSGGMDEASYARVTEELTMVWARKLLELNPEYSFCYCSAGGAGGRWMWARVRQRLEGALKAMPFKHAGAVRPGFIRPGPGLASQVRAYRVAAQLLMPVFPFFVRAVPALFTTSERLGRAMLRITLGKADGFIVEMPEINRLGAAPL